MTGFAFLALLFILTIVYALTLKVCSMKLDHRTAPLFVAGWSLIGLAATAPFLGQLFGEGIALMQAQPWLFGLSAAKGFMMYGRYVRGQELTKVRMSSASYTRPMSVGLIAVVNFLLGEKLTHAEWAAAIDFLVIVKANWYCHLVVSNAVQLAYGLALNRKHPEVIKAAFSHRAALLAGVMFTITEQVKFYQQVTINPIALVLTVQALTQPVILALSALVWKERTVREQILWGLGAFFMVILPFLAEFITNR